MDAIDLPEPIDAEPCCVCCPLLWGVKMVSLVSMSLGMFAAMTLLSDHMPKDISDESVKAVLRVHSVWAVFHTVGFFVGYNGIIGLRTRDSSRIRRLCYYYTATVILEVPTFFFYIAVACRTLQAIRSSGALRHGERLPSCEEMRRHLFFQFLVLCAVHICFARAAWALAKYWDRSPVRSPLPLFGDEDTEVGALRAPLLAAWPMPMPGRVPPPPDPARTSFQPFMGRPLRLD
mmetsp:Transcript_102075/g.304650  ORF Transcript_102075/g.304650 Transcript_102075/m.304650 type:complete len:233 (-) Transcript_102075:36-734(-)